MSFAPKTESPTLSPSTPERRNTFQEAEAVPFGNGYFRVAPKWVSDRFNDHWSNGKTTGQSYCSVAGILCHGPINHIQGVYAGGKLVAWPDITRPDNPLDPNYWSVMIEFGGADADLGPTNRMRVYWGREDQPADSWLASTSGQDHPPYLGQVLIVFERLHCGQIQANSQQRPALPNIELSVIRLPSPSMPSGLRLPATVGSDRWRGINLISGLWDILTHPRAGAGLTTSFLDQADWVAKAAALEDGTKPAAGLAGADAYVSPLLTGASETEKIVLDGLAYVDGWFHTVGGKIRVDWYPNDGNVPGSLPEISEHDMVEPPRVRTGSLAEAPSTIVVECLEGDTAPHDLVEASESVNVPFVRELTGEISVRKLQRPWFTSRGIAGVYASRAAAMATIPEMTGECRVRLDRAIRLDGTPLRVGDRFSFNYAPQSIVTTARITERLEDETTASLRWRRERGVSSQPYVPASDPRAVYTLPDPPTPGATDWTVAEAPPGLSEVPAVVALVRRPSDALSGVRVYLDEDNAWATGSTLLGVQNFAARVTLSGAIGSGDLTCTLTGTDPDVSPTLGSGVTTTEQTDDTLIMLMESEWISLGGVVSGGPGTYTVDIARGRLGSFAAAHADGEYGWVIRRDRVVVWLNAVFTQLVTRYFKVAYYHALADGPLSAAQSVVFSDRAPGSATSFAAVGLPGAIRLTWDNPDETDLLGVRIYESATTTQPADPSWFVAYPGNTFTRDDLAGGVQRYFWIVEVDQTYNTSTTVGPVDATTTSAAAGSDGVGAWTPLLAGTATTSGGSFYKKTGSAAWDASVYSQEGYYRGAAMGARCGALANVAFGLDASPAGSSSNTTIDYAFRLWDGGQIDIVENGTVVASAIGTQVANTTVFQVIYDNTAVRYYVDGVLKRTTTAAADQTLYLDSSLYTVNASAPVLTNVSFAAAGPAGSTGPATPVAQITYPGQAFTRANSGASYSPASITLTSSLANGTASSWLWEYWNGSAWTTAPGTATASTYSVASGDFADARTYRVTINSAYSAAVTMIHVTGGSDGAAGLGYGGTSSTFNTIGTGSKTFYVGTSYAYQVGTRVRVASSSSPSNWVEGVVSSYSSGNLTLTSDITGGSGSYSSWTVQVAGNIGPTGPTGATGATGLGYGGTSTTSLSLSKGSKSLTTQAGLAYPVNGRLRLTYDATRWMEGYVSAYTGTSMTVMVEFVAGSGTFANWTLSVTGQSGFGIPLQGPYNSSTIYFYNLVRRDLVSYSGRYYAAANPQKDGLNTWITPAVGGNADWEDMGTTYSAVATKLLLAEQATITQTLVMGDGTVADGGIFRSYGATNLTTGLGYYLNPRDSAYSNLATFRVGDPSGYRLLFNGTVCEAVLKTFTLKPSASGIPFVVDTDPDFVGPNPPARVTFGTMKSVSNGTVTTTEYASGGIRVSGGTGFTVGTGFISTYGIESTTGHGTFSGLTIGSTGDLKLGDLLYGRNSGDTYDEIKWTQGTSFDVRGVNIRCLDSSGNVKAVLNQTAGAVGLYLEGLKVVGPRGTRGSAGLTEVVALLDAWGAWA